MGDGGTFLARMLRGVSPIVECSLIFLLVMFLWTLVDIAERGVRYISAIWQLPSFPEGDCRLARAVGVGWHPGDRREPQEKPCGGCVLGRTKRVSEFAQLPFRGTDGSGCREGSTDCCKSLA
jgi:hypothetical protein